MLIIAERMGYCKKYLQPKDIEAVPRPKGLKYRPYS